jgi:hypothetical protein
LADGVESAEPMTDFPGRYCCEEDLERIGYDGHGWERDLERLRRNGPRPSTRELIEVIRHEGVEGATVIDIGAGVGAVHLALLEAGAVRAMDVDASREYQLAAADEAERRGLTGRVAYRYGDVVELADELPPAEVVTADAVICCYPYLERFLRAAVQPEPRLVGLTLPRDNRWMRAFQRFENAWFAFRRRPDRWWIHRHSEIDRLMAESGYAPMYRGGPWYGRVLVYRRGVPVA